MRGLRSGCLLFCVALLLPAQEMQEFQKRIADFTLANGLHIIVLERHESPEIAFYTWVGVGSVDDPTGQTGMAHMFEHMALKGTETLGTRNWLEEKKALDSVEDLMTQAEEEARKGPAADQVRVDGLGSKARQAAEFAQHYASPADYRRLLEENGAVNLQALTGATYSQTSYSLPSNRAELWFFTESQRLTRPVFRDFYDERKAMEDEYRQRVEVNPQGKMMAEVLAAAFKTHPYRNPVGGWPSDIANLRRSDAQAFFERYYVPGNITMAMVGDITLAEAKRLAEQYFGPHTGQTPAAASDLQGTAAERAQDRGGRDARTADGDGGHTNGRASSTATTWPSICCKSCSRRAGPALLYSDLVNEQRVAQQAQAAGNQPRRPLSQPVRLSAGSGAGPYGGRESAGAGRPAVALQDDSAGSAVAEARQGAGAGESDPPDDQQQRTGLPAGLACRRLRRLAQAFHPTGRSQPGEGRGPAARGQPLFCALWQDDGVQRAAGPVGRVTRQTGGASNRRSAMKRWMVVLLSIASAGAQTIPGIGGIDVKKDRQLPLPAGRRGAKAPEAATAGRGAATTAKSAPSSAGTSTVKELKFPPLHPIQEQAFTSFTLSNGMRIYLLEDHDLPMVAGLAIVKAGTLSDPPQRIGLAQLAGIALRTGGTNIKTPEQIDNLLGDNAATVDSVIGESLGTMSFGTLKENTGATLQVVKELLAQPGFRPENVELAKTQLRQGIAHRNDVAQTLTRREFASLIYGKDNAYGWQADYNTLDRVKRFDVRAFHQRYYFPANTMLGIWGDFHGEEMKALLEEVFGDWTDTQPPVPAFGKVKNAPAPGLFLAEKKDVQQSYFTIGHLGGMRSDKDYAALEVMAGVLGGGPESRIWERLRTGMAVTNEVKASWNAGYVQPGMFEISGTTKSVATARTIKAIQEEIERMRTAEVTDEECRVARDAALNALIFSHDSRYKLFVRQLLLEYYGYPKDFLSQYQKALQAVTPADVARVAKQYLHPENLTTVVTANPILFGEGLETLGPVTKLDIAIPEARHEAVETDEASMAQGKKNTRPGAGSGGRRRQTRSRDGLFHAGRIPDRPGGRQHRRGENRADRPLDQAHHLPSGQHPPGGARVGVHGWQDRLDFDPAGMGRPGRRAAQPGFRRSLPRVLPAAVERPRGGTHGQRGWGQHGAGVGFGGATGDGGIRPQNPLADARGLRYATGGRGADLLRGRV